MLDGISWEVSRACAILGEGPEMSVLNKVVTEFGFTIVSFNCNLLNMRNSPRSL